MSIQNIYEKLKVVIGNDIGVCGLMGNLKAESAMRSNNLQDSFQSKLGMNDEQYTKAVDNGTYKNFVKDGAGYGLAQWTFWSRKQGLLEYAQKYRCSIGDEDMQISFLLKELASYKEVMQVLRNAKSVREASDIVLTKFEQPADQSESVKIKRASFGNEFYKQFVYDALGKEDDKVAYTNSSLIDCRVKSPNHSGLRTKPIERITPHCVVGQLTAEGIGYCFDDPSVNASCNYGIGTEGRVCLVVDEKNRSWCSSSNDNDQRAVTIECACDMEAPFAFNSKVYNKLIDLCVDICKRNGKTKLLWFGDKNKTLNYKPKSDEMVLTVHRWFAAKECPGDWMYSRMDELANAVTAKLNKSNKVEDNVLYRVQVGAYSQKKNAEAMVKKLKDAGFDAIIKTEKK